VVAPEFIPVLLGPRWGAVVLPFRLFTVSLLFRMSSKISDACTKAAGAVYSRALVQGGFAALVFVGALLGQRWGIGGVAVAVSIAMGLNWLAMAELSRQVTGLSWSRFARAQVPGVVFAALIGCATWLTAHLLRTAHLGPVPILAVAALIAALVAILAARSWPEVFLGPHGAWTSRRAEELARRILGRMGRLGGSDAEALAKANPK